MVTRFSPKKNWLRDKRAKSDYEDADETIDAAIDGEDKKPRNLLLNTLEEIGCQCSADENDVIQVKYQGEAFDFYANNESPYINIVGSAWTCIDMDDPDADLLKQAVNEANFGSIITSIYIYKTNEEKHYIIVFCYTKIVFIHDIHDRKYYLEAMLSAFFIAHNTVKEEFNKLQQAREERLKKSLANNKYQC